MHGLQSNHSLHPIDIDYCEKNTKDISPDRTARMDDTSTPLLSSTNQERRGS